MISIFIIFFAFNLGDKHSMNTWMKAAFSWASAGHKEGDGIMKKSVISQLKMLFH